MTDHTEPSRDRMSLSHGEMAGMDQGMRVLSYLIAGVLVYGGLGWLGDHLLGTGFLLPVGIVLGAAGGCYVIIRRYGRMPELAGHSLTPQSARLSQGSQDDHTADQADESSDTTESKKEGAR